MIKALVENAPHLDSASDPVVRKTQIFMDGARKRREDRKMPIDLSVMKNEKESNKDNLKCVVGYKGNEMISANEQ